MAQLRLDNVQKRYGTITIIPGIDLEIRSGEFLVLVGPSGSGKSTLLKMIAGLEETSGGRILIDDDDVTHADPSARDLAMVFQTYALYPHMTVEQNMAFALKMRKEDPTTIAKRVADAIQILALQGLEKRRPGQLSGGQRQRVAMGRCIVRNPKLFLFDEPLSNLDAKLRAQTRMEIRRLHERLNATSIFVTHDQIEAMTMADRIALLKDGRLQQIGSPQELYLQPCNRFVASFIGSPEMNMFSGELVEDAMGLRLDGPLSMRLPASTERLAALRATRGGRKVEIGVRPEHFTQVPVGAATAGTIPLAVEMVEWLGHDVYLFCGTGQPIVVRHDNDIEANVALPKAGDRIEIRPITDHWHVFDAESGDSLLARSGR